MRTIREGDVPCSMLCAHCRLPAITCMAGAVGGGAWSLPSVCICDAFGSGDGDGTALPASGEGVVIVIDASYRTYAFLPALW